MSGIKKKGPAHKAPKKPTNTPKADDKKTRGESDRRQSRQRAGDDYEYFD